MGHFVNIYTFIFLDSIRQLNMRYTLVFILTVLNLFCFSQDLIIKNDGSKIYCKILEEDSTSLLYVRTGNRAKSFVLRSEVETYYIAKPHKKNNPSNTTNPLMNGELIIFKIEGVRAFPFRDFGSTNLDNPKAGLAIPGFGVNSLFTVKVNKYIGFSGGYKYQQHKMDFNLINELFKVNNPGFIFTTTGTTWRVSGFNGGIYFSLPSQTLDNLFIEVNLIGGSAKFYSPEILTTGKRGGFTGTVYQQEGFSRAFYGYADLGLAVKLADAVKLNLSLGYFYSKPQFNNVKFSATGEPDSFINFEQQIESINLNLGISFLLYKD